MLEKLHIIDLISNEERENMKCFSWHFLPTFHEDSYFYKGTVVCTISITELQLVETDGLSLHFKQISEKNIDVKAEESAYYHRDYDKSWWPTESSIDGIYIPDEYLSQASEEEIKQWDSKRNTNSVLFLKSDSIQEIFHEIFPEHSIFKDPFKGLKSIQWKNKYLLHYNCYHSLYSINYHVEFNGDSESASLKFFYCDTSSRIKTKSITNIHFLFVDNSVLTLRIDRNLADYKDKEHAVFNFKLVQTDLKALCNSAVGLIRIETKSEDCSDIKVEKMHAEMFQCMAIRFIQLLQECDFEFSKEQYLSETYRSNKEVALQFSTNDNCYVYLMLDEANGYHKIGISNHPEYREKTLQSEKPTITLLCAKEYPTRLIAEAIESALHKAFGSKRVRGEWFKLDDIDVENLKAALT